MIINKVESFFYTLYTVEVGNAHGCDRELFLAQHVRVLDRDLDGRVVRHALGSLNGPVNLECSAVDFNPFVKVQVHRLFLVCLDINDFRHLRVNAGLEAPNGHLTWLQFLNYDIIIGKCLLVVIRTNRTEVEHRRAAEVAHIFRHADAVV